MRIQPNGEVSPSVFLHLSGGNILKKSITDILNSDLFKAARNRDLTGTKCEFCIFKERCNGGCADAAYLEYGSFNMPDPLCWFNSEWNVHEKYLCTAYVKLRGEHVI
ncbi:SPASM domain-containing protein [archaeon]|nr:SPASM domain-containing protein [archaeon]